MNCVSLLQGFDAIYGILLCALVTQETRAGIYTEEWLQFDGTIRKFNTELQFTYCTYQVTISEVQPLTSRCIHHVFIYTTVSNQQNVPQAVFINVVLRFRSLEETVKAALALPVCATALVTRVLFTHTGLLCRLVSIYRQQTHTAWVMTCYTSHCGIDSVTVWSQCTLILTVCNCLTFEAF